MVYNLLIIVFGNNIYGPNAEVYVNNKNNVLTTTTNYYIDTDNTNASFFYKPYTSLALRQIKKPDIDMCITIANAILGS